MRTWNSTFARQPGALCIRRTLCRHCDDWYSNGHFFAVWLFLTIGTLLLHCWYNLGRPACDDWYTNGQFCCFDCLLTCDDWYTNGHFCCFDCLLTGTPLVHCWYSLGRPVTIGTPMVLTVFDDWYSVPIVKNSQKQSKDRQNSKMTIGVRIVTCLPRLHQQCTNRQKQSKTVQRQSQSKQQKWPLVYQSSHVYTESAEYTKSAYVLRLPSASAVRVRRIHKASTVSTLARAVSRANVEFDCKGVRCPPIFSLSNLIDAGWL